MLPPGLLDHAAVLIARCGHKPEKSCGGVRALDGLWEPLREAGLCSIQELLFLASPQCLLSVPGRLGWGVGSAGERCEWRSTTF